MTFQQLEYLLTVSQTGSVTKAAKQLFVSYSSISISVSNLEKELGYPLFTRTAKGLIPTVRGLKVIEHARHICQSYKLLNAVDQESKRTVRIDANDNPVFARAFAKLVAENVHNKDVQISIQSAGAEESYIQVVHNRVNLSLRMLMDFSFGYWEKRFKTDNMHREILCTIPAAVRVGKGHRLYDADYIFPYDLKNETLVDNPLNPISKSHLFKGSIYTDSDNILYAGTAGAQRELVRQGLAYNICSMPPISVQQNDSLHYIPLKDVSYYMLAVTNPQYPLAPEITRFLQLLRIELDTEYPK